MTLVAGALRVAFWRFFAAGTIGRLLRFGTLIYVPTLAMHPAR